MQKGCNKGYDRVGVFSVESVLADLTDDGVAMMTRDHVVSKLLGGADTLFNQKTMCMSCNIKKGNKFKFPQLFKTEEAKTLSEVLKTMTFGW